METQTPRFDLQGHRGARGLEPENTIPAFVRAMELGVTTLEMDAVISKDNQVVISHEPWFSAEICSDLDGNPIREEDQKNHRIYDLTYEEIKRYDCGLRGHPRFPRQDKKAAVKPLLVEVVHAAEKYAREHDRPGFRYNIEIKSTPEGDGVYHPAPDVFARLLVDLIQTTGIKQRTTIQSFDPRSLKAAHTLDPDIVLSILVEREYGRSLDEYHRFLGFTPQVFSPDFTLLDHSLLKDARSRGMKVIPWTVNTPEAMQSMIELGVDGLITDYPDLAIDLVPR